MKHTYYYITLMFFASYSITGMELTTPAQGNKNFIHHYNKILTSPMKSTKPNYTFITDENQSQNITIPLELATQCNAIKTMLEDLQSNEIIALPIKNANTENTLEFISYLKKINFINSLSKNQLKELEIYNKLLSQHLQTLNATELINLTYLIDSFDVIDIYNNNCLTTELAQRIRVTPVNKKKCFNRLNNTALFRSVMQKINITAQLDKIIIEPYAHTLNNCRSVPRTESIIQNFKNNMYNAFPWHSPILFVPHYINFQTGTIIKTEEHIDYSNTLINTSCLRIYRNNSPPIIIQFNTIKNITHIEANTDESLFICTCKDLSVHPCKQYYIIDPAHPDKLPCYDICAFTEKNEELYVVKDTQFGIFNTKTNIYTPINIQNEHKIKHITTNKNKTTVAVVTNDEIYIGRKDENNSIIFCPLDLETIKKTTKKWGTIKNICLHPHENKLYLEINNRPCIVNLTTLETLLPHEYIPSMIRESHEIFFISDDILFLGYETGKDYFVNIRTGNHWIKGKSSHSRRRLALTTDCMHSIEKVTQSVDGRTTTTIEIREIIDNTIIKTINCLNKGYYPLTLLNIAQGKDIITLADDDYIHYQNLNETFKTILNTSHTITNATLLSRIVAPFRCMWPTVSYYGKIGLIFTGFIVGEVLLKRFKNHLAQNNKLNNHAIGIFLNAVLWSIQQALT